MVTSHALCISFARRIYSSEMKFKFYYAAIRPAWNIELRDSEREICNINVVRSDEMDDKQPTDIFIYISICEQYRFTRSCGDSQKYPNTCTNGYIVHYMACQI